METLMKAITFLSEKFGTISLMILMILISGLSIAQTKAPADPDLTITPWLGQWKAVDDPVKPGAKEPPGKAVLEIRPSASGKGLEIIRKDTDKPVSEFIFPDGVQRAIDSKNCSGTQTYNWEQQTGLLLGSSEMKCKDSTSYGISNLKMMVSSNEMVDILAIKASDQTRIAVRHFVFEKELSSMEETLPSQGALAQRIALSAPWDLNRVISLSKTIEPPILEAALLEKNINIKLDSKALKQMNAAKLPKSLIDLMVALAAPEKFMIQKNGKVAVNSSYSKNASTTYLSVYQDPYWGYYDPYDRYRYGWNGYWNYYSPFWMDYPFPIYTNIPVIGGGGSGGSGGGGGGGSNPGSPNPYSEGRLSPGNGYIQITPRDTGHKAMPRGGYGVPSGSYGGYTQGAVPTGGSSPAYVPSSGGGAVSATPSSGGGASYSSGGSSSAGSGGSSAPSASPSGYSSGSGSSGQAVPRN
jgi:hypothetical protein